MPITVDRTMRLEFWYHATMADVRTSIRDLVLVALRPGTTNRAFLAPIALIPFYPSSPHYPGASGALTA